jgi:hypothetical protein
MIALKKTSFVITSLRVEGQFNDPDIKYSSDILY